MFRNGKCYINNWQSYKSLFSTPQYDTAYLLSEYPVYRNV